MTGRQRSPSPPSTGGRLVYAVGDVHGHSRLLRRLLAGVEGDAARSRPAERPLLVFLGDYVDRGPDSRGVIDAVLAAGASGAFEVAALRGNHEDLLLKFLADPAAAPVWIANGGDATLAAYGVAPPAPPDEPRARAALAEALPEAHRAFLANLPLTATAGDYLFVHAGVRPGVPLAEQDAQDLIWIRHAFLESEADFGKVIVHGHTPCAEPDVRPNRINIDTGAYFTGVLTAVRLEGETRRFIQARA